MDLFLPTMVMKRVAGLPGQGMVWKNEPAHKEAINQVLANLFCGEGVFDGRSLGLEETQAERRNLREYADREVIIRLKRYDACLWVDYLWRGLDKTASSKAPDEFAGLSMDVQEEEIMNNYVSIFLDAIRIIDEEAENNKEKSLNYESTIPFSSLPWQHLI